MEELFDIGEMLYQKFLLDIYRHCDRLDISISAEEKERMAVEMVDFIGNVVHSLENSKPLVKISRSDEKGFRKMSKIVSERVRGDEFSSSVIDYYVSSKKMRQKELPSYLTVAAIAVVSRGRKTDMKNLERKIKNAKPYLFRVASLLSPAVFLHEKLLEEHAHEGEKLDAHRGDLSFMKYIG